MLTQKLTKPKIYIKVELIQINLNYLILQLMNNMNVTEQLLVY